MIKCNICGIEKETPRQMHGHLIRWHYDEYKQANFNMRNITTGAPEAKKEKPKKLNKNTEAPEGFRLLNRYNRDEAEAYNAGYRYIDDYDMCYTAEEAREEGWI